MRELQQTPERECLQPGAYKTMRMAWRALQLAFVTFGFYGAYMASWPFTQTNDARRRNMRRNLSQWWGAACLDICHIKLTVEGTPPKAPFFLVANHVGYIDIIVLSRVLGCTFIAKGDMEQWPIFGWMMRNAHHLFIRREDFRDSSRAIGEVQATVAAGDGIAVFAEARCTNGAEVAQFKGALFQAPVNLGVPVHYAALYYETPPGEPAASDTIVWWRWEPLQWQMGRMLRLSRGTARIRFGGAPVTGKDRKEVAFAAHSGVCALFEPIAQGVLNELPPPEDLPKHLRG